MLLGSTYVGKNILQDELQVQCDILIIDIDVFEPLLEKQMIKKAFPFIAHIF